MGRRPVDGSLCPRVKRCSPHALVPVAIAGAWALSVRHVRIEEITDLGLISALPPGVFVLLAALTASFALALAQRSLAPEVLLAHVVVLAIMLYGVTALVEPVARFSSVWRHVGIIDYIAVHRSVKTSIDAYFSWPGFFTLGVLITKVAGVHGAAAFAAWGTLAFNLLFLPPLLAIFSWASDDPRVRWLGVWVFYSCNWIGQDYLSPQAVGFLLWLAMLAALLTWLVPRTTGVSPAPSLRAVPRWFGPRSMRALTADGPPMATGAQRVGVLALVVLVYAATVSGHQLTPVPAFLAVTALVIFAGLEPRALPVAMALILAAWIGYMTTTYLAGNYQLLTGSLGAVGRSAGQNVTARLAGSAGHQFVVNARLAMTALIWALALAGFLRQLARRRVDVAIALVGATPFLLPVLQPYGGEILLRVFLFALPAVSFFIAQLTFPAPGGGRSRLTAVAGAIVGCALLAGFQLTRYGNERMDAFTPGDVAAVKALYRLAPAGSKLVAGTANLPWRYRGYADYDYSTVDQLRAWSVPHPDPGQLLHAVEAKLARTGGYVIFTRSTQIQAELLNGTPRALPGLVSFLRSAPGARELYRAREADIFFLSPIRRPQAARHSSPATLGRSYSP